MKIGMQSRYCENCKRDVQDFTKLSRQEILHYLWENRNSHVCGRMYRSQLDYHHSEILITISAYLKKNPRQNVSFYLLAVAALMLSSCSNEGEQKLSIDSLELTLGPPGEEIVNPNSLFPMQADSLPRELTFTGVVAAVDHDAVNRFDTAVQEYGAKRCRLFAEEMPEYVGGVDKLLEYFRTNLKYPEWEKKQKISGTVFVAFIVTEDGKIEQSRIVKSVEGSKNFDKEVLRLVDAMPDWKPGREKGEAVAVQYTMPVTFQL
ncbi:MAG: energy transducer TonB [Cyclobacteriaceae bacterium]|nr:energy transducer TonB [Cyclobacteriaceae bacterium]